MPCSPGGQDIGTGTCTCICRAGNTLEDQTVIELDCTVHFLSFQLVVVYRKLGLHKTPQVEN